MPWTASFTVSEDQSKSREPSSARSTVNLSAPSSPAASAAAVATDSASARVLDCALGFPTTRPTVLTTGADGEANGGQPSAETSDDLRQVDDGHDAGFCGADVGDGVHRAVCGQAGRRRRPLFGWHREADVDVQRGVALEATGPRG